MASRLLTSVGEGGRHPSVGFGPLLTARQIDILYEWIEDGAYWPDNPSGFVQPGIIVRKRGLLDRRSDDEL